MQSDNPLILRVDAGNPEPEPVARAAAALESGGLVVLPTETVYGVAADPRVPGAVARICAAKGRDPAKPIPYLVDHTKRIRQRNAEFPPKARRLAARFWPGPLTLVLPAGDSFEGFRIPNHAVTLAVLRKAGGALRVTSANRSGAPPARTAADAAAALGAAVALALDAGPARLGRPSTVVRVRDASLVEVLREGAIPARDVLQVAADRRALFVCSGNVCRSPMAEYLLRKWLGPNSGWTVESAGVSAIAGTAASWEAIEALRERGIDLTPHRSQRLSRERVDAANLIVVMTASHRAAVLERYPEAREKVFLLSSFAASPRAGDVEDPIGASVEIYRRVRDEIDAAMPDLVLFLHEYEGSADVPPPKGKP